MSDINPTSPAQQATDEQIYLAPKAISEIKRLISEQKDNDGMMLRIGVQGGGCSGLSYSMSFEKNTDEYDKVFDFDGLGIIVDSKALMYLGGTNIDYSDEILSGGFKFSNPNSTRSCGCGTSFSV